jgi:CRP-like cAMP-binding protein
VTSEDGEEMVLVTLGQGEAFGELSIVDGGPRSASAEALEPTVALVITREVLRPARPDGQAAGRAGRRARHRDARRHRTGHPT